MTTLSQLDDSLAAELKVDLRERWMPSLTASYPPVLAGGFPFLRVVLAAHCGYGLLAAVGNVFLP